tara:strand:- start:126 stop:590 length:465 start_codon:yes stop_codon:yes gene_type:complete
MYEVSTWDKTEIVEYFATQMSYRAQGGAAYLENLEYNSFFDIIKYAPLKFFYFVYGPFIWNASSVFTLFTALENLTVWILSIIFLLNIKNIKCFDNRYSKNFFIFLFLFTFLSLAANSLIDSNYGTAIRHKMIYMPIFYTLVFSLLSLNKSNEN